MAEKSVVALITKIVQIPFTSASSLYNPSDPKQNADNIADVLELEKKRIRALGFTTFGHIIEGLGYAWPLINGNELVTELSSYKYDPENGMIAIRMTARTRISERKKISKDI